MTELRRRRDHIASTPRNAEQRSRTEIYQHAEQIRLVGEAQGAAGEISGQQEWPCHNVTHRNRALIGVSLKIYSPYISATCVKNIYNTSFKSGIPGGEKALRLTVYTDYALRLLMYLALKDIQLATIAEIAKKLCNLQEPLDESGVSIGPLRAMLKPYVAGVAACACKAGRNDRARRRGPLHRAGHGDRVVLQTDRGSLCHPPLLCAEAALEKAQPRFR